TEDSTTDLRMAGELFESGEYARAATLGAEALAKTVGNALATGVQSPGAIAEYTAENIPQLAAAAVSPLAAVATNAGYGFDVYRESMTDYMENNNGQLPDAGERGEAAAWAASAALAEQVGDVTMLRGLRGAGNGARRGAIGTVGGVTAAAGREGVTEGYQTYAEAKAAFKDPSLEEVVEGATIGALVGANFQGAASVAQAGRASEQAALASQEQAASVQEAFTSAVESGDVSALADPSLPTYDPVRAVDALNQVSQNATPEQVQANLAQADSIQQGLTQQVSEVQHRLDTDTDAALAELTELRDTMQASAAPQEDLDWVNGEIAAIQNYDRQADEARLKKLDTQLSAVKESAERMRVDTSPEQAEVAAIAEQAQAGNSEAVGRILTLTMTNPEIVSPEVAESLAQNEALSVEQRTALARFSEAQVAANELKGRPGVRSDIATGGDGFKGVSDYRNAIRMALANGDVQAARSQVDGLASFAASRVSKRDAITAAYEQVKGTDRSINIVRNEQGVWEPTTMKGK
ncbi:MAG: hypothetical protein J6N20_02155, partial [Pseudomonas sp.]|nr:hypothetical protein [Pseudomonas sp.]